MDEKTFQTQEVSSSNDIVTFYDNYAETWDARFALRKSTDAFHKMRLGSFLNLAGLSRRDVIAELGVGTGVYLKTIAPMVKEVICIDGSKKMLDVLKEKNKELINVRLVQCDLEEKCDFNFKVNLLYCFGLIEHIIDLDCFIENCKSMLLPKGRLVFVTPNARSPWYGKMRSFFRAGKHCSSDHYYTKESLDSIMRKKGFQCSAYVYWGYFPAGISDTLFALLSFWGEIIDRTPLRRLAGGMTLFYELIDHERLS